jgi:hypothetical protein
LVVKQGFFFSAIYRFYVKISENMNRHYELLLGGLFVAVAVILNFSFMGRAIIALNVGLIISYIVWASNIFGNKLNHKRIALIYFIGVCVQCVHFLEEYITGFQTKFPAFFGYQWSDKLFAVFNLIWLGLFFLAAWGVFRKVRLAYFIVWFFALIGEIGNGLFHPLISIVQKAYFPGLISSFFHLIIGILLIKELGRSIDKKI